MPHARGRPHHVRPLSLRAKARFAIRQHNQRRIKNIEARERSKAHYRCRLQRIKYDEQKPMYAAHHKYVVYGPTLRTAQLPQPSPHRRSLSTLSSRFHPSHFRHLWNLYRCCLKWSFLAKVRSGKDRSAHATNSCERKCF